MDTRDAEAFGDGGRAVDHVELEDGTLLLFDPVETDAWIQCGSPIYLPGEQ